MSNSLKCSGFFFIRLFFFTLKIFLQCCLRFLFLFFYTVIDVVSTTSAASLPTNATLPAVPFEVFLK